MHFEVAADGASSTATTVADDRARGIIMKLQVPFDSRPTNLVLAFRLIMNFHVAGDIGQWTDGNTALCALHVPCYRRSEQNENSTALHDISIGVAADERAR